MKLLLAVFRKLAVIERLLPYRLAIRLRILAQKRMGILEPEIKLLSVIVSPGDHVLDIGTNAGIYTYHLSRRGCKVEAFEPLSYYARPMHNAHLKNVTVHEVALSDSVGEGSIHIPIIDGQPRRTRASIEETSDRAISQKVAFKPLDEYGFTDVRFIKIDVEGHEFSVLRGGERTISATKPVMLVEIEQHRLIDSSIDDVFAWFRSLGYSGFFYRERKLCSLEEFDVTRDQVNAESTFKNTQYVNNFIFLPAQSGISLPVELSL